MRKNSWILKVVSLALVMVLTVGFLPPMQILAADTENDVENLGTSNIATSGIASSDLSVKSGTEGATIARYSNSSSFLAPIDPPVVGSIPIVNRAQLEAINNDLSGTYHLTADIDLSGAEWSAIADETTAPFMGVFDGQGYTINNLTISGEVRYAGLFGRTHDAVIKNIGMKNTNIDVDTTALNDDCYAGAIVGYAYVPDGGVGSITNAYNTGNVISKDGESGGICGSAEGYNSVAISYCYNTGNISGVTAGGITGDGGDISYSYNTGSIDGMTGAGGISGFGNAENCYNTGAIASTFTASVNNDFGIGIWERNTVGGIVGGGLAEKSFNIGSVSAVGTSQPEESQGNWVVNVVGGIIGNANGDAIDCYNTGSVSAIVNGANGENIVGGIVGWATGCNIINSYNIGQLSSAASLTNLVGGIAGLSGLYTDDPESTNVSILNCYFDSSIASEAVGRIWGTPAFDRLESLSSSEMKQLASTLGNAFADDTENINDGYPILKWQIGEENDDDSDDDSDDGLYPKSIELYSGIAEDIISTEIIWGDALFDRSAIESNHILATAAMALSFSAYSPNGTTYYVDHALAEFGFDADKIQNYNYPSTDSTSPLVGHNFAHKISKIGGQEYNIIAVVIRGTTGKEWYNNFEIGEGDTHAGFDTAANETYINLYNYLRTHGLDNDKAKNKFLITGHSRGAAVANLLAARITRDETFAVRQNIYAYTFATPNPTKDANAQNIYRYNNIFNFVNAEDFVPYVPMSSKSGWNFWKYGTTYVFPSQGVGSNDGSASAMKDRFRTLTGKAFVPYKNGYAPVQKLVNNMYDLAPRTWDYEHVAPLAFISPMPIYYTPREYFNIVAGAMAKEPGDWKYKLGLGLSAVGSYIPITSFFVFNLITIEYAHDPATYLAWMQATDSSLWTYNEFYGRHARIACPVDIEIYNSAGTLVGKVTNNVVDETISGDVFVLVDEDVKHVYMPSYDSFNIRFTATDTGKMDYSIEDIDIASASATAHKGFLNVALSAGKQFKSDIGGGTIAPAVRLFVTDGTQATGEVMEDGTETPIHNNPPSTSSSNGSQSKSSDNTSSTSIAPDPFANLLTRIKTAVDKETKETPTGQPVKATVQIKNANKITLAMLKQAADTAKKAGGSVTLHFDTMSADGKTVLTRIYIKPELATSDIILSVNEVRAKNVKMLFEKYFKNKINVVSFEQQGSFGMPVELATQPDPTLDTTNLAFYSYDSTTNSYKRITNPSYWVDRNGYVHFTIIQGGNIIISDGALEKR